MSDTSKILPLLSIEKECQDPIQATVTGEIPSWLSGNLFRVGPGNFDLGDNELKHWFDGHALIHKFQVKEGKVTYQNKFLQSQSREQSLLEKRVVMVEFGSAIQPDPCKNIFQRVMTWFSNAIVSDNCNVHLLESGDKLMALTETPMVYAVDRDTLHTGKLFDVSKYAAVHTSTAHPHTDSDGNIISFGFSFGRCCQYGFFKMSPPEEDSDENDYPYNRAEMICSIPSTQRYPSYVHSYGMTDNFIILLEQPLYINHVKLVFTNIMGGNFEDSLYFDKNKATRFLVIRKDNGKLVERKFVTDALFLFHHINAFEDDGHVVVDICAYPDNTIIKKLYLANLKEGKVEGVNDPFPVRYVLPMNGELNSESTSVNLNKLSYSSSKAFLKSDGTIHCTAEALSDNFALELPRINYEHNNGKKYRFVYGVKEFFKEDKNNSPKLIKLDVEEKTHVVWREEHCFPSEPVFVPHPDAKEEDDGVVLSSILKMDEKPSSFLLILDAKTFKEIARADVNYGIPVTIHGLFTK